jgi:hypothetical protein
MTNARVSTLLDRIVKRFGTAGGVGVQYPIPVTASAVTITFLRREWDTDYGVLVTPSWPTTVAVTARTTTGFDVSFGTAAPPGATVDWCLFRSED